MAEGKNPSQDDITPGASEKAKKWRLSALILAGIFLLSAVLPPDYKGFAPLLLLVPVIVNVMNKIRQAGEIPGNPARIQTNSPSTPDQIPSPAPYTHRPKDPKDPRRYKPIG